MLPIYALIVLGAVSFIAFCLWYYSQVLDAIQVFLLFFVFIFGLVGYVIYSQFFAGKVNKKSSSAEDWKNTQKWARQVIGEDLTLEGGRMYSKFYESTGKDYRAFAIKRKDGLTILLYFDRKDQDVCDYDDAPDARKILEPFTTGWDPAVLKRSLPRSRELKLNVAEERKREEESTEFEEEGEKK